MAKRLTCDFEIKTSAVNEVQPYNHAHFWKQFSNIMKTYYAQQQQLKLWNIKTKNTNFNCFKYCKHVIISIKCNFCSFIGLSKR